MFCCLSYSCTSSQSSSVTSDWHLSFRTLLWTFRRASGESCRPWTQSKDFPMKLNNFMSHISKTTAAFIRSWIAMLPRRSKRKKTKKDPPPPQKKKKLRKASKKITLTERKKEKEEERKLREKRCLKNDNKRTDLTHCTSTCTTHIFI